jgi:hypothetical protein
MFGSLIGAHNEAAENATGLTPPTAVYVDVPTSLVPLIVVRR